jgi:hypothetical protein
LAAVSGQGVREVTDKNGAGSVASTLQNASTIETQWMRALAADWRIDSAIDSRTENWAVIASTSARKKPR